LTERGREKEKLIPQKKEEYEVYISRQKNAVGRPSFEALLSRRRRGEKREEREARGKKKKRKRKQLWELLSVQKGEGNLAKGVTGEDKIVVPFSSGVTAGVADPKGKSGGGTVIARKKKEGGKEGGGEKKDL